jgi:hypothetical protein
MTTSTWRDRGGVARIVTGIGVALALILVLQIVFRLADTNPQNGLVRLVENVANALAIFFRNLFLVDSNVWQVIIDYGMAAIFWLVIAGIIARFVRG